MGTEGKGAQESAATRAEYVPVWLTKEQWKSVQRSAYAARAVSFDTLRTIADAIDWAESR